MKRLRGEPRSIVGDDQGESPRIDHHVERHARHRMRAGVAQQIVEHLFDQGEIEEDGHVMPNGFRTLGPGRQLEIELAAARGHDSRDMVLQLPAQDICRKPLPFDRTVLQLGEAAHGGRVPLEARDLGGSGVEHEGSSSSPRCRRICAISTVPFSTVMACAGRARKRR